MTNDTIRPRTSPKVHTMSEDATQQKRCFNLSAGFTLVEIAVAVAILGLALTTLIGLHTRMLDTYYNEKNRTKSAFLAQYVMTIL